MVDTHTTLISRLETLPILEKVMKKLILATALLAGSSYVMAASGPAGCGLGTEVIFKDANEWHEHVLAATTNGTSGNQTFGMTSGTLGCEAAGGPLASNATRYFEKNMQKIASDASRGEGESLSVLAALLGVEAADQSAFNQVIQSNFDSIFAADDTVSADAVAALAGALKADLAMSKYVS